MDPFSNLVVINLLLSGYENKQRQKIIRREPLIAFVILILCALAGTSIPNFLGLEQSALRISGRIILFLVALCMVFPQKSVMTAEQR